MKLGQEFLLKSLPKTPRAWQVWHGKSDKARPCQTFQGEARRRVF